MNVALRRCLILAAFCFVTVMLPCCSLVLAAVRAEPSPLLAAVFAKGLTESQEPVNPSNTYYPSDTFYLSLKFKGHLTQGVVTTKLYLRDELSGEAKVDLADVKRSVSPSTDQNTYAGFIFKPRNPYPISENYRVEITLDGKPLGICRLKVVPPAGAIPSRITQVTLAKGVDKNHLPLGSTKVFSSEQLVYLTFTADMGTQTGIEVNWYVNGKADAEGTRSILASTNVSNMHYHFSFQPASGWKPGKQEVVLRINGKEAGRYAFTIK